MENVSAPLAAGQTSNDVVGRVCRALEEKGRVQVNFGKTELFEELLQGLAEDNGVSLVVLARTSEIAPWHERLRSVGLRSEVISERAPPPRLERGMLWASANWLSSPDHQAWCARHVQRIIARVPSVQSSSPASVPLANVWCPGDGVATLADVAMGFGQPRRFSVQAISGGVAREVYLAKLKTPAALAYRGGRLSAGSRGWSHLGGEDKVLVCAETPSSLEELAEFLDATEAEEVTVLFGPDDLLSLQREALDDALQGSKRLGLFDWLSGEFCRAQYFAAAFGETTEECGRCDVCALGESLASARPRTSKAESAPPTLLTAADAPLFEALRDWRSKMARSRDVPAYHVFSNAVLASIARERPRDEESFLAVKGCGERKWQDFGAEVLAIIEAA